MNKCPVFQNQIHEHWYHFFLVCEEETTMITSCFSILPHLTCIKPNRLDLQYVGTKIVKKPHQS